MLASPTHPDPLEWSRATRAKVQWEHPADSSGIAGYYWTLDQSLGSIPDPRSAPYIEKPELELEGLKDGSWFVHHVVTKDTGRQPVHRGRALSVQLSTPRRPPRPGPCAA